MATRLGGSELSISANLVLTVIRPPPPNPAARQFPFVDSRRNQRVIGELIA